MRISVARLRVGLLVGAGLLIVAIAAFLGYARYRLHRGIMNLPGRLGATITSESDGYTYSQSDGKKTVFTIHAAKAVQHSDGKYTLHDVNMILYGHKGDRADRISGSDFEYDTKAEIIRAQGTVHIDLAAPAAAGVRESEASKHLGATGLPTGVGQDAGAGNRVIHVTTSGLTYVKAQSTASTDQGLDFAFGGFTGHAVGAEYHSDSGRLVLQTAVMVSGLAGQKNGSKPIALTASHGELDREANQADFEHARYSSAGEVAQADLAHLHLRADGTVERIAGVGQVVLEDAEKGRATSDHADVMLDAANKPKTAVLTGNVKFNEDEAFRQANGGSNQADLSFDEQGRIDQAVLRGAAHAVDRVRPEDDAKAPWSERTLVADLLILKFVAAGSSGKAELREAQATGSARLNSVSAVSEDRAKQQGVKQQGPGKNTRKTAGTTTTKLAADQLQAHFVDASGLAELSTVHGTGHALLEQSAPGGIEQSSRSETLAVRFRPAEGKPGERSGTVEVADAVQEGGVVIDRSAPAKPGKAGATASPGRETQHRVAGRAEYDADSGKVTLTDGVQMIDATSDTTSTILAAKVVMDQDSGDATAEGGVKVTYLQAVSAQPVHVLAARAELSHDQGKATFYGMEAGRAGAGLNAGLARMWQAGRDAASEGADRNGAAKRRSTQGGSQIEAPVLVFEQESNRLTARAEKSGMKGTVHTVLAAALSPSAAGSGNGTKGDSASGGDSSPCSTSHGKATAKADLASPEGPRQRPPVRITSDTMVYADEQRQAVFTGGVRVVDADGEMRAPEATVFLTPAETKPQGTNLQGTKTRKPGGTVSGVTGKSDGMMAGQVDRIVVTQGIELTQPGRQATGDRLVYTAADQLFVLTGTAAAPPKVVDDQQGSTTGAMMRFHSGDCSVTVLGSDGNVPARRVHTETRIKKP